jgi:hypothetical protein
MSQERAMSSGRQNKSGWGEEVEAMLSCRWRAADNATRSDGGAVDDVTRAGGNYDGK